MLKLSYIVIISILFVSINCSNNKSPVEAELMNQETGKVSDSIEYEALTPKVKVATTPESKEKKLEINSIVPYHNPVSIEELHSKIYVVDTLYTNLVP